MASSEDVQDSACALTTLTLKLNWIVFTPVVLVNPFGISHWITRCPEISIVEVGSLTAGIDVNVLPFCNTYELGS